MMHVKERVENPLAPTATTDQALCMVRSRAHQVARNSRAVMGIQKGIFDILSEFVLTNQYPNRFRPVLGFLGYGHIYNLLCFWVKGTYKLLGFLGQMLVVRFSPLLEGR